MRPGMGHDSRNPANLWQFTAYSSMITAIDSRSTIVYFFGFPAPRFSGTRDTSGKDFLMDKEAKTAAPVMPVQIKIPDAVTPPPPPDMDPEEVMASDSLSVEDAAGLRKAVFSNEARLKKMSAILEKLENDKNLEKDIELRVKYGAALWILRRPAEALKALDGCRTSITGAYIAGRCLVELDRYTEASELLEKTLNRKPNSPQIALALVTAMEKAGEAEKCLPILKSLAASSGVNDEVLFHQGFCSEYLGFYTEAYNYYEKALKANPSNEGALFKLAYRADLYDDEETSLALYMRCLDANPPNISTLMNLGILLEDQGQYEKAADCYQKVLNTYPNHPRANAFLADAVASLDMNVDEEKEKKEDKLAQVLRIPVTDFELSVRSRNCLKKMMIQTLGDLISKTEVELLSYKNFGETSLAEIKAILESKGLTLGMDKDKIETKSKRMEARRLLDTGGEDVMNKPIGDLGLSIRSRKCMDLLNVRTIGDLLGRTEADLLACKNFGLTSLQDVRQKLMQFGLELSKE